ncbi:Uncharacterised protein [Mycobacterium tuberculosis]|nr:Uncharacterised protein [Mycobacterium tuberculosis]
MPGRFTPIPPTPGGSPVPRAKTTSTSGHAPSDTVGSGGAADAAGTGANSSAHVVTIGAPTNRQMLNALTDQ